MLLQKKIRLNKAGILQFICIVTLLLSSVTLSAQRGRSKSQPAKTETTTPAKTTAPAKTTTTPVTTTKKTTVAKPVVKKTTPVTKKTTVAKDTVKTTTAKEIEDSAATKPTTETETTDTKKETTVVEKTDTAAVATDSTTTTDTAAVANKVVAKPKEIKKLKDANLPPELEYKIQNMTPNELLVLKEDFRRNIKEEDNQEYVITTKLLFAQDAILGYIKKSPLYLSSEEEMSTTIIRIPVKFCCTNKLDTTHKKQHCGMMSELNDLEDIEHCSTWMQKDEAPAKTSPDAVKARNKKTKDSLQQIGEGFGKPGAKKPTKKEIKKGAKPGVDIAADSTGTKPVEEEYGKPTKEDKKKKPGKKDNKKSVFEDEPSVTDSSGVKQELPKEEKPKKSSKKEEKKKEEKVEDKPIKPEENSEAENFGKPAKKDKKADKKKKTEDKKKDDKEPVDSTSKG